MKNSDEKHSSGSGSISSNCDYSSKKYIQTSSKNTRKALSRMRTMNGRYYVLQ